MTLYGVRTETTDGFILADLYEGNDESKARKAEARGIAAMNERGSRIGKVSFLTWAR